MSVLGDIPLYRRHATSVPSLLGQLINSIVWIINFGAAIDFELIQASDDLFYLILVVYPNVTYELFLIKGTLRWPLADRPLTQKSGDVR